LFQRRYGRPIIFAICVKNGGVAASELAVTSVFEIGQASENDFDSAVFVDYSYK
jgi:hypothetical protein